MNKPTVSIVIPVYNVENYIGLTLDSILNQTFKDFEVILIDDGSTDNSKEIIENYANQYKNITVIYQENSGPGVARNKGIKLAQGEYIAFVDSDDLLPNRSLELRVNAAIEQNSDLIIGGTHRFNNTREWPLKEHFIGNVEQNVRHSKAIFWTVGPCNKLFRRDLIQHIEFATDINYGEDQVFVLETYLKANKIYFINEMIYLYRMREEDDNKSLTQQNPSEIIKQIVKMWTIIDAKIDAYTDNPYTAFDIKERYLERLIQVDIWPRLKAAITSRNEEWQKETFQYIIQFLDLLQPEVINKQNKFKWVMSKGLIEKFLFVHRNNRKYVIQIINMLVLKLDVISKQEYKQQHGYLATYLMKVSKYNSTLPIYQYLIHRRVKRLSKKIDDQLIKLSSKGVFNLVKRLPVKKNLVVLATNRSQELEGNLRYLSKELEKNEVFEIHVYLNESKRTKVELAKMYYHFARAKFIFVDDYYRQLYNHEFNSETEVIQLWHACGAFKRFGFSAIGMGESNTREFELKAHSHYTRVVTSAKEVNEHFAEAFNIAQDRVLNLGIPRTDLFLNDEYKKYTVGKLEHKYPELKGKKVILYAPTFRGSPKERKQFNCELDYQSILEQLGEEYVIMLKFHPVVNEHSIKIPRKYRKRVLNMTRYKDINELMLVSDILISDYSSVIFEYSLLNRPMIFFAYDLDTYLDERNFYYSYESLVPGPIVKTTDEIIELIKNKKFEIEKVDAFKHKFFDDVDGQASKRIVDFMLSEMK